jgi:hypothetical protein
MSETSDSLQVKKSWVPGREGIGYIRCVRSATDCNLEVARVLEF